MSSEDEARLGSTSARRRTSRSGCLPHAARESAAEVSWDARFAPFSVGGSRRPRDVRGAGPPRRREPERRGVPATRCSTSAASRRSGAAARPRSRCCPSAPTATKAGPGPPWSTRDGSVPHGCIGRRQSAESEALRCDHDYRITAARAPVDQQRGGRSAHRSARVHCHSPDAARPRHIDLKLSRTWATVDRRSGWVELGPGGPDASACRGNMERVTPEGLLLPPLLSV